MDRTQRSMDLFGSVVEMTFYYVDEDIMDMLFPEIQAEALRLQKIFNIYDSESELSLLNKTKHAKISDELEMVLDKALKVCEKSKGIYDISKGKQFLARKSGKNRKVNCTYHDIELKNNSVNLVNDDVYIDLGSIAKGYIADKILDFCQNIGLINVFIDARGDLRSIGNHPEIIEIQDPREPKGILKTIILEDSAITTSGDYKQYQKSYENNHIVGSNNLASATVIANTMMEADVLATLLMIAGKDDAEKYLEKQPALIVDTNGKIKSFNKFDKKVI